MCEQVVLKDLHVSLKSLDSLKKEQWSFTYSHTSLAVNSFHPQVQLLSYGRLLRRLRSSIILGSFRSSRGGFLKHPCFENDSVVHPGRLGKFQ